MVTRIIVEEFTTSDGREFFSSATDTFRFAWIDDQPMIVSAKSQGWIEERPSTAAQKSRLQKSKVKNLLKSGFQLF